MRKVALVTDEYYHIYNRGVEKRTIVEDILDVNRFMQSIADFNTVEPIGSIHEKNHLKKVGNGVSKSGKLVEFVAFCLNPNHFHFLLKQVSERGIEQFMQRFGSGYTKYFNHRHNRVGSLFQGPFKAIRVVNDEYLLHLSAYINLNNVVHQLEPRAEVLHRSSWEEYVGAVSMPFCAKEIVLERFNGASDYKAYATDAIQTTLEGRMSEKDASLYSE